MGNNTKKIAINTMILYIRMVFVTLISLYTSRVTLQALGVDDFGLYQVVGGVVGLLTFFNATMRLATQRFLNLSMVKGNDVLSSIFASSITIHMAIACVFLFLGETIGLMFLNTHIHIPESRILAANIVYQASMFSFCVSVMTIPYSALVVAYEKMGFLALTSVISAIFKLGIVLFLVVYSSDRLILYGILVFCLELLVWGMYLFYCMKKYPFMKFRLSFDKENLKQISSFVSWTLVGQFAVVACNQGNIILVNMFHALSANAAMTIGAQVNAAICNLTSNFQTAFNPQITKSYSEENFEYLKNLLYITTKLSFCIMFVVVLPMALNIDRILDIWLDEVPLLSNSFTILFLASGVMNAISSPFIYAILSSPNIRDFQVATAFFFLMDLPVAYLLFQFGLPPTSILWVKIAVISIMFFVRVYYASNVVNSINFWSVLKDVLMPILLTSGVTISTAFSLQSLVSSGEQQIIFTIFVEIISVLIMWYVCLSKHERTSLIKMIVNSMNKK